MTALQVDGKQPSAATPPAEAVEPLQNPPASSNGIAETPTPTTTEITLQQGDSSQSGNVKNEGAQVSGIMASLLVSHEFAIYSETNATQIFQLDPIKTNLLNDLNA